jgi:hypothetical protein
VMATSLDKRSLGATESPLAAIREMLSGCF